MEAVWLVIVSFYLNGQVEVVALPDPAPSEYACESAALNLTVPPGVVKMIATCTTTPPQET